MNRRFRLPWAPVSKSSFLSKGHRPAALSACLVALLWLALPGPLAAGSRGAQNEEGRHVVILHTNDLHGQVLPRPAIWLKDVNPPPSSGGLPRVAAALRSLGQEAREAGAAVVICDGGDWFQGTPEGQIDRGAGFLGALQHAGHDGMVVGNHEFDHGVDVFLSHLAGLELPALLANVKMPDGAQLPGTVEHIVLERGGMEIALVGLLTTSTPSITHKATKELLWEEPASSLARVRAELGSSVDLVIPITHIGIQEDRELAKAHPDLPVIVGGHSHTFLRKGVREGGTLIVQAGAKASVIGRVDLWLDQDGKVLKSQAAHVDLYEEPSPEHRVPALEAACAVLQQAASQRMDEVVGVLGGPLEVSRRELVNATGGNFITDLMRARSGAEIAVHNRGGTRTTLPAGVVTRRDLFMLLPFDNHIETLEMSGSDVIHLFKKSIEDERRSGLEFSGVTLEVRRVEGKPVLVRVLLGGPEGEVLDPDARVRLATNSFLAAGGDGWEVFREQTVREIDSILLRDMLEEALATGPKTPARDQRYVVLR